MGTLAMITGAIFPIASFGTNSTHVKATLVSGNTETIPNLFRKTLYGVAGVDETKDLKVFECTDCNAGSNIHDGIFLHDAISHGCKACIVYSDTLGSSCTHDSIGEAYDVGNRYNVASCYYINSGVCAPLVASGTTYTGNCYGSLFAPNDVMSAMGCVTGNILTSGKIMADEPCHHEEVSTPTEAYDVSCESAWDKNPLPFNRIFVPKTDIFDSMIKPSFKGVSVPDVLLKANKIWLKNGSASPVFTTEDYGNVCQYAGCSGIEVIDADGNYKTIPGVEITYDYETGIPIYTYKDRTCTQYGTAKWQGTPPNCTATITSKNCDNVSTDPAGVWTKTCTYSN